ncbi:hypothetical protein L0222_04055 [bacterium]|nr:hypothetical protein [bacterium]
MATLTIMVCDECGKEARRLIEINHGVYCSRECYLTFCKRLFDLRWIQALRSSQTPEAIRKSKTRISKVA